MARFRGRGIGDLIPTKGEGRALVEIKGSVGAKGRSMRRYGYRGGRKASPLKMAPMVLNNANWDYNQINLLWRSNNADASKIQRLMNANSGTLGGGEVQPNVFVKKISLEMAFMAGIGKMYVGGRVDASAAVRDDVAAPGPFWNGVTSGPEGTLLNGTIDNSNLVGPASWYEGQPARLWFGYETLEQASDDPDTLYGSFAALESNRNKTVFWSKVICPAVTRPEVVRLNKVFPGRGVRLSQGTREIESLTMFVQGYTGMGTVVFPVLSMAIHRANVWYTDDA